MLLNNDNPKKYVVTKTILNNITDSSLNNFIRSINKTSKYTHSGQEHASFFTDLLDNGELTIGDFNEYLFNELFYGKQRSCYLKKIDSFVVNLFSEEEVLHAVSRAYPAVKSSGHNYIANTYFSVGGSRSAVVAFKIVKNDSGKIIKIKFIFAEEVEIINPNIRQFDNSYIPIEIDLERNYLITKVYPKTMIKYEHHKPEFLAMKYINIVTELFGLAFIQFEPDSKKTIYFMSKELFNQIYKKMVKNKPKDIEKNITLLTEHLTNSLNIKNLDNKKRYNKFFDFHKDITTLVENILICDTFYDAVEQNDYSGIDGFIVYLKFTDGKNVDARLKGENSNDSISTSEAFLVLRSPIDNAKSISLLKVRWVYGDKLVKVKYEATSSQHLHIHYYSNLSEGEFYYGLEKYEEFQSKDIEEFQGLDSISPDNMA